MKNENIRPVSAMIKRPDSAANKFGIGIKVNKKPSNNNFNNFPMVQNNNDLNFELGNINKVRPITTTKDKERLYEENFQLKNYINSMKRDFAYSKSECHKLELELNKKEKIIEDIAYADKGDGMSLPGEKVSKAKETHLIIGLKKQFKDVQRELKNKTIELENIKKTIKNTKINELNIEVNTYTDELQKLKSFYEISLQQNAINENNINELLKMQDSYSKQQTILLNLQDNNNKLLEGLRSKDEEINRLKQSINHQQQLLNKNKIELKKFQQLSGKISQNTKDGIEVATIKSQYEKKVADLSKDLAFYKDAADKRDRRIKELEKFKNTKSTGDDITTKQGFNSIKQNNFIQENPEERGDTTLLLLKSKLQEMTKDKERLEQRNKFLEEKLGESDPKSSSIGKAKQNNANITGKASPTKNNNQNNNQNSSNHQNNQDNILAESQGDIFNSSSINEDQLNEFTYTLIKNFEALKIDSGVIEARVFSEVNESSPEEVAKDISSRIISLLKVKNEVDIHKVLTYITTLFLLNGGNLENFKEKFLSLFESITYYNVEQGKLYSKKIKKKLLPHQEYLIKAIQFYDKNNTGFISFFNLRNIFETINLKLKDTYVEYLIYVMKTFSDDRSTLEDLKYDNIFKLIEEAEDDSRNDSSELEEDDLKVNSDEMEGAGGEGLDESEVVISQDTFEKKVEMILGKMAEYFFYNKKNKNKNNKNSVETIIRNHYGPSVSKHQVSDDESYDAIPLGYFVKDLSDNIGIKVDTIDIYCIFTKLKYSENYETIDIDKVIEAMKQFFTEDGTLDINIFPIKSQDNLKDSIPTKLNKEENIEDEDLFVNLNKFLKEKSMLFDDLLVEFDKLIKDHEGSPVMSYSDFVSLMHSSGIITSTKLSSKILTQISYSDNEDLIDLNKLKNILSKTKNPRPMSGIGTRNNANANTNSNTKKKEFSNINEDDLDQVNISKDVPNDSKIFNESLSKEKLNNKKQSPVGAKKRPPSAKNRYEDKGDTKKAKKKADEDEDDVYQFTNDNLNDSDSFKKLEKEILKENQEIAEKRAQAKDHKEDEDEDEYNDFEN